MDFYRGLIIVEPYGTYIRNRTKTIIVKSKKIKTIVGKDLLLIQNKLGLGIIKLGEPIKISLKQFKKLYKYHQILETDRKKWWGRYQYLYAYPIIFTNFYKQPLMLNYSSGPQITITPARIAIKKVFIGMSGYYYYNMYPRSVRNMLEYYSKNFNSVEINSTFYHLPSKSMIANLGKYNLIYSIKVSQYITHAKKLGGIGDDWYQFYNLFKPLFGKIGCFLFQFSKNFYYNDIHYDRFKKLSTILDKNNKYAFEFRNKSWFNNSKIEKLFKMNKWILVISHITNVNGWAGNLDNGFNPSLKNYQMTSDTVYFRMHGTKGKYIGEYNNALLNQIINFIGHKQEKNIFIYFNNTDSDANAFRDAKKMISKINILNL